MKFKIFGADDIRQAYRQGLNQKEKIQNYGWWDRNLFKRPQYKKDVNTLHEIDKKVSRKRQNLIVNRGLATIGVSGVAGGAIAASGNLPEYLNNKKKKQPSPYGYRFQKTASSRLLQILKGTRLKQLKGQKKEVANKLTALSNSNAPQLKVDTMADAYNRVSKSLRRERLYTHLSRGTLGTAGLMGVLKANQKFKEKKASLSTAQKVVLTGMPVVGATTGTAAVLGTKDIENSPKNLASAAAIGAGTAGAFSAGTYFLLKNPHLINKLKQLAGQ